MSYYDDEKPKRTNKKRSLKWTSIIVAFIAGIFAVIVAFIGAFPVGYSERPLACSFDNSIINGIYNCNGTLIILEAQVATELAIQPTSTITPDYVQTSVVETGPPPLK